MTNGEKFRKIFKEFATEVWAFPEKDFLTWLNAEYREQTTKNDLALIHTEGLDEEIRCTMCTNYMKSDRGCDGACVVNKDMYKAVMDAIEKRIQPSVTPEEPRKGHWIYIRNSEVNGLKIVKCSECGKRTYGSGKYCPNCGADMREVEK